MQQLWPMCFGVYRFWASDESFFAKTFSKNKINAIFAADLVRRGWRRRSHEGGAPRGIHNKSDKINVRNC